jgi:hypothetical protein
MMYKLTFYVPDSHLDMVKSALFSAGAGQVGDYEACCWQVKGTGQFRPKAGANPFLGKVGALEQVEEWRVEMVLADQYLSAVIAALRQAHPYEEPAFDVMAMVEV